MKITLMKMLLAAATGSLVWLAGCGGGKPKNAGPAVPSTQEAGTDSAVGNRAPDFSLKDLKGNTVKLRSDTGDQPVTVLVFWATWCPPCRKEIPHVKKFSAGYSGRGVRTISINVDKGSKGVTSFAEKAGINYPVLLDGDSSVAGSYNVRGIPNVLVLDKSGIVRYNGHSMTGAEKIVKELL